MEGKTTLGRRLLFLSLAGIALAATLTALLGQRGFREVRRYARETRSLQEEIRSLEADVRSLQREVLALRSDPAAIERIARQDLGLARPGEVLFLLPPETQRSGPAPAP